MDPYRYAGFRLNKNIYSCTGVLLAPASTVLTRKEIELLFQQGIEIVEDDIDHSSVMHLVSSAVDEMKVIFKKVRNTEQIPVDRIREKIVPIIIAMSDHPNLYPFFNYLERHDEYTYRHSIGVAMISKLIGKERGLQADELLELTIGAFLHDIGKAKIPDEIMNKPGKLTPEQFALIKKHTIYGYQIMKNTAGISHRQALVALQHHEREDGRGYPYGLKGEEIDLYSKIVAVADVFHAMISKRVYKNPLPFYKVLLELSENAYGILEPETTLCFVKRFMDMTIGSRVLLSNGRVGKIVFVGSSDPARPLIEVNGAYIDLSKDRSIHLERIL